MKQVLRIASVALLYLACRGREPSPPPTIPAPDPALHPVELANADELEQAGAGIFGVHAYVVYVVGGCPPCEGPAPCSPCEPSRIQISARRGTPAPSEPGVAAFPQPDGLAFTLFPGGRSVDAFKTNELYYFVVEKERTKAGAAYELLGATPPHALSVPPSAMATANPSSSR